MRNDYEKVAPRYKNEVLTSTWQVDESKESLDRLLRHLKVTTNFWSSFEEALSNLNLDDEKFPDNLVIADIGSGVSWTSAIMAEHPKVKRIYAIDPSQNRLKHAQHLFKHLHTPDKITLSRGEFLNFDIPEKVDIVLLCASLHHCFDEQVGGLFDNIRKILKPGGTILVANEHYVDYLWTAKRVLSCVKNFFDKNRYYSLGNLHAPDPFSSEHCRRKKDLERIFEQVGVEAKFYLHEKDVCNDKHTLYHQVGWHYYNAILKFIPSNV